MSSIESKIIIEHYENGGFGVFRDDYRDKMGLIKEDVINLLMKWLIERN